MLGTVGARLQMVFNPMPVDGQVAGGAVQGPSGAMIEAFVYDEQGQLVSGSLMN
jgi:carbon-monoxide dehydrogenase large subunit